jgi:histidine triad (HIT) family protein
MTRPNYDDQNIFAKILRGEIPNNTAFEDDHVLAFHDIAPQAPVHILVIPKGAYVDLADFSANAPEEEIVAFHRAVAQLTKEHGLVEKGFRAIANIGDHGGQEVPHFHLHLLGGKKLDAMLGD